MVLNSTKEADAGASETAFPRRSVGTINKKIVVHEKHEKHEKNGTKAEVSPQIFQVRRSGRDANERLGITRSARNLRLLFFVPFVLFVDESYIRIKRAIAILKRCYE
jgi:hypothetical protein